MTTTCTNTGNENPEVPAPGGETRRVHLWAASAILLSSLLLRVFLASQGGQNYFWDEDRYAVGVQLYRAIGAGDYDTIAEIAAKPTHPFFFWICAGTAAVHHLIVQFTPYGDWSNPQNILRTMWVGAALLSCFSTLNLLLLYLLAKALGASNSEACWAMFLMAASNTGFYYSRHFLPYDAGVTAALLGALVTVGRPTVFAAGACGALCGATFNVYNGYWYLVPILWSRYVFPAVPIIRRVHLLAVCGAATFVVAAMPLMLAWSLGGSAYLHELRSFAGSATMGLFREGWTLPWEYFWWSEQGFGVTVVLSIFVAWLGAIKCGEPVPPRVKVIGCTLLAAYMVLVLFSTGLRIFVVYARTVKPFVPLFCLLGGWAMHELSGSVRRLHPLMIGLVGFFAALNFWPHFVRSFPFETETAVLRGWGTPKRALTFSGTFFAFSRIPVTRPDLALVNARELYPIRSYVGYPAGRTVFRVDHPLSYRPFQYECHTPRERQALRDHDISIRLIKLSDPAGSPDEPPLRSLYQLSERPTGYEGHPTRAP
ncbi:MAG: hypothetical protein ABIZ04_22790 [Opitutus sp.]